MPEYAGFSIALASQYDAATIPESRVRVLSAPTHLDRIATESPGLGVQHSDKTFQDRGDGAKGTVVEACVPVWAGSQFWVCYACPPPSAGEDEDSQDEDVEKEVEEDVKYFYFKLYVSGRCVLSWGVGEEGKWKGKTMFGLFDGGRDFEGRRIVEKRGLFFPNDVLGCRTDDDGFEIRIFRAKARRREVVDYQGMSEMVGGPDRAGFLLDLTSIGKVQRGERQRFYSYALIDAKDEPWVTFRYKLEPEEGEFSLSQDDETHPDEAQMIPPKERARSSPRPRTTRRRLQWRTCQALRHQDRM